MAGFFDDVERERLSDLFDELGPPRAGQKPARGLELHWAGTDRIVRARRGQPTARIAGPPGELLLYLFGRQSRAQVEVTGADAAIEAVRRAHFGM